MSDSGYSCGYEDIGPEIVLNCLDFDESASSSDLQDPRDNYLRLPRTVASLSPSGPIIWEIRDLLFQGSSGGSEAGSSAAQGLPSISALCLTDYNPESPEGFFFDLAGFFEGSGIYTFGTEGDCFFEDPYMYTVAPIDPSSEFVIPNLAEYDWSAHWNFDEAHAGTRGGGGGGDVVGGGVLGVITTRPSGGAGAAAYQIASINPDGSVVGTGEQIAIFVPRI